MLLALASDGPNLLQIGCVFWCAFPCAITASFYKLHACFKYSKVYNSVLQVYLRVLFFSYGNGFGYLAV